MTPTGKTLGIPGLRGGRLESTPFEWDRMGWAYPIHYLPHEVVQVLEIVQHHSLIHAAPLPDHASSHRSLAFHWFSKVQLLLGGFHVCLGLFHLSLP